MTVYKEEIYPSVLTVHVGHMMMWPVKYMTDVPKGCTVEQKPMPVMVFTWFGDKAMVAMTHQSLQ